MRALPLRDVVMLILATIATASNVANLIINVLALL
jgi:hypothetical protein